MPDAELCGTEVPVVWRGRRFSAFVPALLAERDLALASKTISRAASAAAEVGLSAEIMPEDHQALARLLLRSEGVASSYIEGVSAPLVDVVLAEGPAQGAQTPAAWVAANLAAVTDAVAAHDTPMSVELLCGWHRTLMTGSPTPGRYVGAVREEQGWIGGTSPFDAALVTPPAEYLPGLLADLVAYANRDDVDPVAQAAIAHAQFEVIHPFGDGNGRIGRVLVAWLLTRRLNLVTPPPVSARLAADTGGYLSGLSMFRFGQLDPWVAWFADAVAGAGREQRELVRHVGELQARWRAQLGGPRQGRSLRGDALAWEVLELLPQQLVLTAALVAERTGSTTRAARGALYDLADAGVLVEHAPGGPRRRGRPALIFVSPDLLALAGSSPRR